MFRRAASDPRDEQKAFLSSVFDGDEKKTVTITTY